MNVNKEIQAEAILSMLAELRAAMPRAEVKPKPQPQESSEGVTSVEDFEMQTVLEAIESVAAELSAALDEAQAKAMAGALEVYYKAEELARDPAHADLIPHVEAMRKAYEKDFGHPIPPRKR